MEPSGHREGQSHSSSCATPQTEESGIDTRKEVTFNLNGVIISGKNDVKNRCLSLVKTHVGLSYGTWKDVDIAKKNDVWDTIVEEFKIPVHRKDEILKEMGAQLKTYRKNLRVRYFKGLDINGIKALKDNVPEKEEIPLSEWNEFIKHESSEAKMKQRESGKFNRSKKSDLHCLGRQSYAEKTEEMMRKDPLRRPPVRSEVFLAARKQRRTGEFHPKITEQMKLVELKSSQASSSSQSSLENDVLTGLYGKDHRGRVRGVGAVSKGKLKAMLPVRSEIEKVVQQSNFHMEQGMREIQETLKILLQRQNIPVQPFSPQPSSLQLNSPQLGSLSIPSNETTPCHRALNSSSSCGIYSVLNAAKKIATGVIVSTATTGTIVHGHVLVDFERKVQVLDIVQGEERHCLYLGSQGGITTIKEAEGGWVVWPIWLLH